MRWRGSRRVLHAVVVIVVAIDAMMAVVAMTDDRAAHASDHGAHGTCDDRAANRAGDRALGGVAYGAGAAGGHEGQAAGRYQ